MGEASESNKSPIRFFLCFVLCLLMEEETETHTCERERHTCACETTFICMRLLGRNKKVFYLVDEYFHFVTCLTQSPRGERYKERQRERKKTDTDKDRKKKYRAKEKHKVDRNIKQNRERCHKMKK